MLCCQGSTDVMDRDFRQQADQFIDQILPHTSVSEGDRMAIQAWLTDQIEQVDNYVIKYCVDGWSDKTENYVIYILR